MALATFAMILSLSRVLSQEVVIVFIFRRKNYRRKGFVYKGITALT